MAGGREQGMAEGQAAYAWRRLPNAYQKASAKGLMGFPSGTVVKNMPDNAGDARVVVSISGSGRSPGEGNGNPLQYSCLGKFQGQEPGRLQSMGSQSDLTEHSMAPRL